MALKEDTRGAARKIPKRANYAAIRKIDASHPTKDQAPGTYVEYRARKRAGGRVAYFNFRLAKEMGLIPKNHPEQLSRDLSAALLDTFGIIIINEYDITRNRKFPKEDIKPNTYMATRYLQLQHEGHIGLRSGDGRSIWNGVHHNRGTTWDISSCGTGATCLSPSSAKNNIFYKSGDKTISYGCGYSNLSEGIIDVLFSEIFNRNNILSERTLCVIGYPGSMGITVRAGLNLLRPSHFFNHLRQGQYTRLQNVVDLYIEREIANKTWPKPKRGVNKYDYLVEKTTETFARICARYESDYIFCWLDWDGDNILANGGVIDFGSVRQFGLYHHTYKFDDDDRWSTNIKEQKTKAKHIITTFAQLAQYLKSGVRKPRHTIRAGKYLKTFDRIFKLEKRRLLLIKLGFTSEQVEKLMAKSSKALKEFENLYYAFESAKTQKGPTRVPDGITYNAVYCMRDVLAELPRHISQDEILVEEEFLDIMLSKYADKKAKTLSTYKSHRIRRFQLSYLALVNQAKEANSSVDILLKDMAQRSKIINSYERITGDSICEIGEMLTSMYKNVDPDQYFRLVDAFLKTQVLDPENREISGTTPEIRGWAKRQLDIIMNIMKECREGL